MKRNDFVVAKTHKDFLNDLLGLHLGGYMKSSKVLDDGRLLWMIRLDGNLSPSGWINYMQSEDIIVEEHIGREYIYQGHGTYISSGRHIEDRVVFDIVEFGASRKYIFRGVFRLDKASCTLNKNIWYKISDKYIF
jgi:hypothetical protein